MMVRVGYVRDITSVVFSKFDRKNNDQQETAVMSILRAEDVLAVLPTAFAKSMI